MLPLRKMIFGLIALLAIGISSATITQAQTTALDAFNTVAGTGGPNIGPTVFTQSSSAVFQFGYTLSPTGTGFNLFNRVERPNNPTTPDPGGARLSSTAFGGSSIPAAFDSTASINNTEMPVAPGPYLLLNSSGATLGSDVRFNNFGAAANIMFTGFFQGDPNFLTSTGSTGTFSILLNGVQQFTSAVTGAAVNFNLALLVPAGSTVDFLFVGTTAQDNLRFNVTAVPEPATMLLLGISGLGVAAAAFRRRRKSEEGETDAACVS